MSKFIFLIAIIIAISLEEIHSQGYFNKRLDLNGGNEFSTSIIEYNGNLYIQVAGLCESNERVCNGVIKSDAHGNQLWKFIIYDTLTYNDLNSFTVQNDTIFLHMNYLIEGKQFSILYFDLSGDYLGRFDYEEENSVNPKSDNDARSMTGNSNYIATTYNYKDINHNANRVGGVNIYDHSFNLIRKIHLKQSQSFTKHSDVEIYNDGSLVAGYSYTDAEDINRARIAKYNSEGGIDWITPPLPFESWYRGGYINITKHPDGGIAGIWTIDTFGFNIPLEPSMIFKLDNEGDLEWSKIEWSIQSSLWDLFCTRVGDIVVLGRRENFHNDTIDEPDFNTGYIVKYSQSGEKLWDRQIFDYTEGAYWSQFTGGCELENGELVLSGIIRDSLYGVPGDLTPANVWLVRLDSNGCITPDCDSVQILTKALEINSIETNPDVFIYPNPVMDKLFIVVNKYIIRPVQYTIYDLQGTITQTGLTASPGSIGVDHLAPGHYIILLKSDKHFFTQRFVRIE